jgi:hypothetical protein
VVAVVVVGVVVVVVVVAGLTPLLCWLFSCCLGFTQ